MFYIYILYSFKSDIYYIGQSENLWDRLIQHNNSDKDTFTSKHRPWILKSIFFAGNSRAEALKFERKIKKMKSRTVIEDLINPEYIPFGSLAQLVRVPNTQPF